MATVDDAVQSQVRNIEQATGRSMDAWVALVKATGMERHSEILAWLKTEHGFSHGNANLVALIAKRGSPSAAVTSWSTRCTPDQRRRCARCTTASSRWLEQLRCRRRAGAQAGLRQPAPLEAVRDGRPGTGRPTRDRPQSQGRRAERPAGGHGRDVHPPSPTLVGRRARR